MKKRCLILVFGPLILLQTALGTSFAEDTTASTDAQGATSSSEAGAKQQAPKISAGKILKIVVYREPDLSGAFKVDDTGHIAFPLIGNVHVEGREPSEIVSEITQSLKKFLIDPQISMTVEKDPDAKADVAVAVKEQLAASITVLGEVRQPGSVEFVKDMTLSKIIAETGGFTPTSDTKKIKIIRQVNNQQQQLVIFSMEKIEAGETSDPTLQPGDKVVVPKEEKDVNTVAILGEVKSAGVYEVTPGITLMRVIAKAGGFSPTAATNKVRVVRQVGAEKKVFIYNAAVIINGQSDDPEVLPGDMIFVPETFF